ncbi:mandelate racemase/muconate lactonizing enzyme family protein [Alterisphingorhabdus coralli]|uniref:Mandelate racemase/muconate lactonizing enzyme family protein n=1 Tax=Alterisphingorhabdus coralli TaxID=3071408 RepID=A0AA97F6X1_9SPHN|nr:mandelate racemase/muconate lactonizing enzyme family protein [Parasphingorhabdus sp. SCSIO 66989]WOE75489.1 mandelate racemase/muconate lactonizing enzyme family protein [Parasphingorhabdus sp. SCSIO 66989]
MRATRIEKVESFVVGHWHIVCVTGENGVKGFGEGTYYTHPLAASQIVEELAPNYEGQPSFCAERVFSRILKLHCFRDMASMGAMSAIDQAIWDLNARTLDMPVWELLGGRVRDRVRAILLIEAQSAEEMVSKSKAAAEEGFTAIKLKPFVQDWATKPRAKMLEDVVRAVHAVRAEIGTDIDIAIEIHRNLLPCDIAEFSRRVASISPYFIEDPVLPYSVDANRYVASHIEAPVALAERNMSIWEFREYSDSHDIAILRPDIGMCGGFTQGRKIAAIAESRHQRIVPHNFTSPVLTAAHIQMAAATPNWDVQGYVREDRQPWLDMVEQVNRIEDGYLVIPDTPGLGIAVNEEFVRAGDYKPFGNQFQHRGPLASDGGVKHQ